MAVRLARLSLSILTARASGCRARRPTSSLLPATIPACGPPNSLSPEKNTSPIPARMLSCGIGSWVIPNLSVGSRLPLPTSCNTATPRRSPSLRPVRFTFHLGRESFNPKIAGVNLQISRRVFAGSILIVPQVCAVGGAHVHQRCPALTQHVGNAEAASDFHSLGAGYDYLASGGQRQAVPAAPPRRYCSPPDAASAPVTCRISDSRRACREPRRPGLKVELQVGVSGGRLLSGLQSRRD